MSENSKIQWTHHTFNPWWGCQRVSPGCENCYAETFAHRLGRDLWGPRAARRFFGDAHWSEPLKWDRAAAKAGERHRVFCASMADVFEDRADLLPHRARLFRLVADTPHLDWLLLTKRPENAQRLWADAAFEANGPQDVAGLLWRPNVWLGTTVEDQRRAEERIPDLLAVPALVRFLSCEPLLGPVDLTHLRDDEGARWNVLEMGISWVIVGGESGNGARPFAVEWARSLVEQCRGSRRAVFVKQLGAVPVVLGEPTGEFRTRPETGERQYEISAERLTLSSRKGGDPSEWPEDLRVREFPITREVA